MSKGFASSADNTEKKISFTRIGSGLYAFTAEGDPNSGVIVGDDAVMVVDAQATPVMAREVIDRVAKITDKPIRYVLLSHYHAVRVLDPHGRIAPCSGLSRRRSYSSLPRLPSRERPGAAVARLQLTRY